MKIKPYIALLAGLLLTETATYAQQDPAVSSISVTPSSIAPNQPVTLSFTVGNEGTEAISGADDLNRMGFTLSISSDITSIAISPQSPALNFFDITYNPTTNTVEGIQKVQTSIAGQAMYEVVITGITTTNTIFAVANVIPSPMASIQGAGRSNDARAIEAALPVTLTHFDVQAEGSSASLQWATTEEVNSDRFEVQHSINGQNWVTLATVKAKHQSNHLQKYAYNDITPESGINYYRLKMIDLDGSFTMSSIKSVEIGGNLSITFSPNPVSDLLTVQGIAADKVARIDIRNTSGTLVKQSLIVAPLSVQHLPAGMYLVVIHRKDGSHTTHKIIKY